MRTLAPAFLARLQPPDLKATASQGVFVYCYLRKDSGTPYYVGVATRWHRPVDKGHNCAVPRDRCRIRVLRSALTWQDAARWEMVYVAKFGRKNNGTGILRNLTDGGEGCPGMVHSPETRAKISASNKGQVRSVAAREKMRAWVRTPEMRAKISAAKTGVRRSAETRAKLSRSLTGRKLSPEHAAKSAAAHRGLKRSPEFCAQQSAQRRGEKRSAEVRAQMSRSRMGSKLSPEHVARARAGLLARGAAEVGLTVEEYGSLSKSRRELLRKKARQVLLAA